MSLYLGPLKKTGFLLWRTVCFTGWDEWAFRTLCVIGIAAEGAALGWFIGMVVTALGVASTVEMPPLMALAALMGSATSLLAASLGAVFGGLAGAWLAWMASCPTCGSCIEIAVQMIGGRILPVVPIVVLPKTSACTVMIPPGCP